MIQHGCWSALGWALLSGALLACRTDPATQIIVVVATDIPRTSMDGFATRVLDRDHRVVLERRFSIGDETPAVQLPADYAIGPKGDDPRRAVRVEVDAMTGDEVLFGTHAVTRFRESRSLRLDMFLASRCLAEASLCDEDERCTEEGCVPATIDPDDLPPFVPGTDAPDGGGVGDGGSAELEPWARLVEADGSHMLDLAFDPGGDLYVLADYRGEPLVEGWDSALPLADGSGLLLVRYSRTGEVVWAVGYPGGRALSLEALAIGADGQVMVVGWASGPFDVGGGPADGSASTAFVVSYEAADGAYLDRFPLPSVASSAGTNIAVGADGVVGIVGNFATDLQLGAPFDLVGDGSPNAFLVLREPDGSIRCSHALETTDGGTSEAYFVDFDGNAPVVGGRFSGTVELGSGSVTSSVTSGFVVRYDEGCSLQPMAEPVIAGPLVTQLNAVLVSGREPVAVGQYLDTLSIGTQELPSRGALDIFVVRYPAGDPLTASLGGIEADLATAAVALPGSRNVLIAGSLLGSADFGGLAVDPHGTMDGFVAKLDPEGLGISILQLAGEAQVFVWGVAVTNEGDRGAAIGSAVGETRFPDGEVRDFGLEAGFVYGFPL